MKLKVFFAERRRLPPAHLRRRPPRARSTAGAAARSERTRGRACRAGRRRTSRSTSWSSATSTPTTSPGSSRSCGPCAAWAVHDFQVRDGNNPAFADAERAAAARDQAAVAQLLAGAARRSGRARSRPSSARSATALDDVAVDRRAASARGRQAIDASRRTWPRASPTASSCCAWSTTSTPIPRNKPLRRTSCCCATRCTSSSSGTTTLTVIGPGRAAPRDAARRVAGVARAPSRRRRRRRAEPPTPRDAQGPALPLERLDFAAARAAERGDGERSIQSLDQRRRSSRRPSRRR